MKMENPESPEAKAKRLFSEIDSKTKRELRTLLVAEARGLLQDWLEEKRAETVSRIQERFEAQGFSAVDANFSTQKRWEKEKLFTALKLGLQTEEEGRAIAGIIHFANDVLTVFFRKLAKRELNLRDLLRRANESFPQETIADAEQEMLLEIFEKIDKERFGIFKLCGELAEAQILLQDSSTWKDAKSVSREQFEWHAKEMRELQERLNQKPADAGESNL